MKQLHKVQCSLRVLDIEISIKARRRRVALGVRSRVRGSNRNASRPGRVSAAPRRALALGDRRSLLTLARACLCLQEDTERLRYQVAAVVRRLLLVMTSPPQSVMYQRLPPDAVPDKIESLDLVRVARASSHVAERVADDRATPAC